MADASVISIGIDARELLGDATGVGRYLGELLRRWSRARRGRRGGSSCSHPAAITLPLPRDHVETRRPAGAPRGTWWEQTALRRAVATRAARRVLRAAYTAPLGLGVPLAVTIHDVSFVAHPEWFRPREGLRRRWLTRQAARVGGGRPHRFGVLARRDPEAHPASTPRGCRVIPPGVTRGTPGCERRRRARAAGAVRRLDLQSPAGSPARRRVRGRRRGLPDARLVIVGADRSWPALDLGGARGAAGVASGSNPQLRQRRRAGVALRARLGVRVPVRIRGLRPDAARGAVRGRADRGPRHADRARGLRAGGDLRAAGRRRSPTPPAIIRSLLIDEQRRAANGWPPRPPCWRAIPGTRPRAGRWTRSRRRGDGDDDASPVDRHRQLQRPRRPRALPASLFAAPARRPHEIVVVDNASRDGSAAAVRAALAVGAA